ICKGQTGLYRLEAPMQSAAQFIAVYGSTGHTGRFVLREAQRRGFPVGAGGPSAARLDESLPSASARRVAAFDDPVGLGQAFAGCAVVINCAGPFLDTAAPVGRAGVRAGWPSLDVPAS